MGKLFVVAKREYLERVRSRWFLIITLIVPVFMAIVLLFPIYLASHGGASSAAKHITILDATNSGVGARIAKMLNDDSTLTSGKQDSIAPRLQVVTTAQLPDAERAATAQVELPGHIVGYLVLDDSTLSGKSARYAGRNASSITDMEKLEADIRQQVMIYRLEKEGVRQDIVGDLARNRLHLSSERLSERGRSGSGQSGLFAGIAVGVLLFFSIILHGQNILRGVLEEKTTRVAEIVISSVKPETLLAGKVLGVGAVGLTQQVAWFAISIYLMNFLAPIVMKGGTMAAAGGAGASPIAGMLGAMSPAIIGVALAYFIIGFTFYASLYAAAGSMVNSEQEAQQAAMPVMMLAMSTWILVNPVILAPNGTLAVVLSWLPWSSPIIMPMRMGITSVPPLAVAGSMAVAVLGCFASVWLSARIYRVGMLMYGKKPSFAELAKWLRYA
jgi:ABC-2 type transport system permease protein